MGILESTVVSLGWLKTLADMMKISLFVLAAQASAIVPVQSGEPLLHNLLVPPSYVHQLLLPSADILIHIAWERRPPHHRFLPSVDVKTEEVVFTFVACFAHTLVVIYVEFFRHKYPNFDVVVLLGLWCIVVPFYRLAIYYQAPSRRPKLWWFHHTVEEFAMRLHFCWLTGAAAFAAIDTVQFLRGDYLSFTVYAGVMAGLLALAFKTYSSTHDPAVAVIATWFIVGLVNTESTFSGDVQETFEKLQTIAMAVKPVFALMVSVDVFQFLLGCVGLHAVPACCFLALTLHRS
jgi:hypothetical protein